MRAILLLFLALVSSVEGRAEDLVIGPSGTAAGYNHEVNTIITYRISGTVNLPEGTYSVVTSWASGEKDASVAKIAFYVDGRSRLLPNVHDESLWNYSGYLKQPENVGKTGVFNRVFTHVENDQNIRLKNVNVSGGRMFTWKSRPSATEHGPTMYEFVDIVVSGGDCDSCAKCGPEKPIDASIHSVDVKIGLGKGSNRQTGVGIRIKQEEANAYLATRVAVSVTGGAAAETIYDEGGVRQVLTAECLADLVPSTQTPLYQYEIRLYRYADRGIKNGGGLYTPDTVDMFRKIVVENPNGAANFKTLRLSDFVGGQKKAEVNYVWDSAAQKWTLLGNDDRVEEVTYSTNGTQRIETKVIRASTAGSPIISKVQRTYQLTDYGKLLVKEITDPGGANLVEEWEYFSSGGSLKETLVKWHSMPDGRWEAFEYSGSNLVIKKKSGWLNTPLDRTNPLATADSLCVVETTDFSPGLETWTKAVAGSVVEKRYVRKTWSSADTICTIREAVCVYPGALEDDSTNLVTTTVLHGPVLAAPDEGKEGKPIRIHHPDGTVTKYQYVYSIPTTPAEAENVTLTTTVDTGAWNGSAVTDGTRRIEKVDRAGNLVSSSVVDIASGFTLSSETTTAVDSFGKPAETTYEDGTKMTVVRGCCGPETVTDRTGQATTYEYDDRGRVVAETKDGVARITKYDGIGRMIEEWRRGTDGREQQLSRYAYDLAGRLVESRDALNRRTTTTTISNGNGTLTVTTTAPDGGTTVETYARDGQLLSIDGTAVAPKIFEHSVEPNKSTGVSVLNARYTKEIKVGIQGATTEWTKSFKDGIGRVWRVEQANGGIQSYTYNSAGQLVKAVDADNVTTLYAYNAKGELEIEALDFDRLGSISYGGLDRIMKVQRVVATRGTEKVRKTTTRIWNVDNAGSQYSEDNTIEASIVESTANGRHTWTTNFGRTTERLTTLATGQPNQDGLTQTTTVFPDGTSTVEIADGGLPISFQKKGSGGVTVLGKTWTYDSFLRVTEEIDARNGATSYTYYDDDQIKSITTPAPAAVLPRLVTSYVFDNAGRRSKEIQPDNGEVNYEYWPTGALKKTWGARTYPVEYTYDPQGRMKTLTTWQNYPAGGAAVTTWDYHPVSGMLSGKRYADGKGPTYTYTAAGRLASRVWARNVTTTYGRNNAGEVSSITYSDGTTPNVSYSFNRRGQIVATSDAAGSKTYTYAVDGQAIEERFDSGMFHGSTGTSVTWGYDAHGRRINLSVSAGGVTDTVAYAYDSAGRIQTITSGDNKFVYGYVQNSNLVQTLTSKHSDNVVLTSTKGYDQLNRLTTIGNVVGNPAGNTSLSHQYTYNAASQRTKVSREDGSRWDYTYDSLGQVTSGSRKWVDNTLVSGQQYSYSFDTIGNRKSAAVNGRQSSYTANTLNEYDQRTNPGAVDIIGEADSNAIVTVNELPVTRKGDYFHREVEVDNSVAAGAPKAHKAQTIKTVGARKVVNSEDVVTEASGTAIVPPATESFSYDADGNMLSDGQWIYKWDGENRLIEVETWIDAAARGVPRLKLSFSYDSGGRRVKKEVRNWNSTGGAYVLYSAILFIYDGWNLIGEFNSSLAPQRLYQWGLDLSGSSQDAGGIGGLLAMKDFGSWNAYFHTFDGSGNVQQLVDAVSSVVVADYTYGPFGEVLKATGVMPGANPFRYSSKYQDQETDFLYYGFRYYNPTLGRWLSRDPVAERGGLNLWAFLRNDGVCKIDLLGLVDVVADLEIGFGSVGSAGEFFANDKPTTDWKVPTASGLCECTMVDGSRKWAAKFSVEVSGYIRVNMGLGKVYSDPWRLGSGIDGVLIHELRHWAYYYAAVRLAAGRSFLRTEEQTFKTEEDCNGAVDAALRGFLVNMFEAYKVWIAGDGGGAHSGWGPIPRPGRPHPPKSIESRAAEMQNQLGW